VSPPMRILDADDLAHAVEDSALAKPEPWIPGIEVQSNFGPHSGWTEHVDVFIRDCSDSRDLVEGKVNGSAFAQDPHAVRIDHEGPTARGKYDQQNP